MVAWTPRVASIKSVSGGLHCHVQGESLPAYQLVLWFYWPLTVQHRQPDPASKTPATTAKWWWGPQARRPEVKQPPAPALDNFLDNLWTDPPHRSLRLPRDTFSVTTTNTRKMCRIKRHACILTIGFVAPWDTLSEHNDIQPCKFWVVHYLMQIISLFSQDFKEATEISFCIFSFLSRGVLVWGKKGDRNLTASFLFFLPAFLPLHFSGKDNIKKKRKWMY